MPVILSTLKRATNYFLINAKHIRISRRSHTITINQQITKSKIYKHRISSIQTNNKRHISFNPFIQQCTNNQITKSLSTSTSPIIFTKRFNSTDPDKKQQQKPENDEALSEFYPDPEIGKRATVSLTTKDYTGALANILNIFSTNDVNMTRIESRYGLKATEVNFYIDVDVPPSHRRLLKAIEELKPHCLHVNRVPAIKVHWFPITAKEVDSVALLVLDGGTDLEADHPGFHDQDYKIRRSKVTKAAEEFKYGDDPAIVDYSAEEIDCWNTIWRKLKPLLYEHACDEYIESFEELQKYCGYKEGNIPQLADVSGLLYEKTGFRLRPTAGLLSSRHFLNGLAFNTFFCTQYLRHHSVPFYTPEPDVVHELVGHAPMFADPEFARFSQEIGLASIGANDTQIEQLARCYWFSVEFGLCGEPNSDKRKIYGGGILSSFGEIEYSMSDEPEIREWDPWNAAQQEFPITKYQPIYYMAKDFNHATQRMKAFANSLDKPFTCRWNDVKEKLLVDRNVQRLPRKEKDFGEYIGNKE